MKKLIILLAIVFLNTQCISLALSDISPNVAVEANVNAHIKSDGNLYFNDFTSDNWSNDTGDNFVEANFKDFSGETYLNLTVLEPLTIQFNYSVSLSNGILNFVLVNEQNTEVWRKDNVNVNGIHKNSVAVEVPQGKYKLKFLGNNAKGNYSISWE